MRPAKNNKNFNEKKTGGPEIIWTPFQIHGILLMWLRLYHDGPRKLHREMWSGVVVYISIHLISFIG